MEEEEDTKQVLTILKGEVIKVEEEVDTKVADTSTTTTTRMEAARTEGVGADVEAGEEEASRCHSTENL